MVALKKQRPLIRYAGSAAETSIGSKPIGSELRPVLYCERRRCQASQLGVGLPGPSAHLGSYRVPQPSRHAKHRCRPRRGGDAS